MTILITGSNGFIGRALTEELIHQSFTVRGLVRTLDKAVWNSQYARDLEVEADWSAVLHNVSAVVHLAGRAHIMHETASDPLVVYRRANALATTRLAEAAARQGVKRFVFVSSIKVNGETTTTQPFRHDDVVSPTDAYAVSKWEAEQSLRAISAKTGMEVVIIRPPLVYGPGAKGNFERLAHWVQRGWPLPLGGCHNLRSLVGLSNLTRLLSLCVTHPAAANNTFLVSDGDDVSTAELVRRLARALSVRARLFAVPERLLQTGLRAIGKASVYDRLFGSLCVDIAHTKQTLGWTPPCTMAKELDRLATWLKSRPGMG